MDTSWLKTGARCRTKHRLLSASDMRANPMHIENRRPRQTGLMLGPAEGHDGSVWLVQHDEENRVAAYWVSELSLLQRVVEPEQWALFE